MLYYYHGAFQTFYLYQVMTFSKLLSNRLRPVLPADADVFKLSETSTMFIEIISSHIHRLLSIFIVFNSLFLSSFFFSTASLFYETIITIIK